MADGDGVCHDTQCRVLLRISRACIYINVRERYNVLFEKGQSEIRLFHFVVVIYSKLFTIGILGDEDVI